MKMTVDLESLARISAYLAENIRKLILEKERFQNLACEAKELEDGLEDQIAASESQRLDRIFNNEPLGFEKSPSNEL